MLQVENLTVYYQTLRGQVHALEDVSFSIDDGEIMGLAGESGCGKTTLGHSLIYLNPPMKHIGGQVKLNGEVLPIADMHKMDHYRFKEISIIPQYAMNAMNPIRKIGQMTEELLRARKMDYQAILPELKCRLDWVKLPQEVLNMYPIELSGGMKQRMVMVLSTLLNPSLLIADEITSALDVASQKAVAEMLVDFRDQKCANSAIFITHDISILYQIADSIMIMYAGQLAEKADTETIIHNPRHPYTCLLISSLPEIGVKYTEKKLMGIPGKTPLLLNPPVGCRFRDRCPFAFEKCVEVPPFVEIEKGHFVACWKEPPMLKLDRVSKVYKVGTFGGKELHAVSNVSFEIKDGEVVSLIGESGSGKSTIGKMILRLIGISGGTITLDGINVANVKGSDLKEYYRKVQGVFQDPFSSYNPIFKADRIFQVIHDEFYPQVSAEEWKAKVEKALRDGGLNPEHVLNKFPHQLSGGQLQRFLIARALLLDIKFLVADEIISMLDASTRIDVLNLLAELKKRGLSILFITHDLSLANYISERAVILYRGCAAEMGTTEKIFTHPYHPYTQMLIASVPRLDKKWDEDFSVECKTDTTGAVNGCVYFDRCPFAYEKCRQRPEPVEVEPDHFVACWKVAEEMAGVMPAELSGAAVKAN